MQGSPTKRGRNQDNESQQPVTKRSMSRKRAVLACQECRVRKRKCDSMIPSCGGCMKRMSVCVYSAEVEAREWHYSVIASLRDRLEELEKVAEMPHRKVSKPIQSASDCTTIMPVSKTGQAMTSTTRDAVKSIGLVGIQQEQNEERSHSAAQPLSHTAQQDAFVGGSLTTGDPAGLRSQMNVQTGHLSRCIEPCSFERLMKPIDQAIDESGGSSSAISASIPSQDLSSSPEDPVIAQIAAGNCTCDRLLDAMRCQLPLRRLADKLVAIFFQRHNRMFPIVHQPTFMKQYERLWESKVITDRLPQEFGNCAGFCTQKSHGKLFPATVNAVFALASLFMTRSLEQNALQAQEFFRHAEEIRLFEVLNDEVGIELVQLGLLISFYLQSTERFSKCFSIAGLTIRMAQNMGLHFDIEEARRRGLISPPLTQLEGELRSRVWHACVVLDTETSMSFRQPRMISSNGTHVKLPDPIDDDRLCDETSRSNTQPDDLPSLMEYYIQTVQLYTILGEALDKLEVRVPASPRGISKVREILDLDTRIMEWREALPLYLKYDPSSDDCTQSNAFDVLDMLALSRRLYCRFVHTRELILRPALELLFEKQQRHEKSSANSDKAMETKLQDSMLHKIAAQCVLCASNLVDFLTTYIEMHNFDCWWYNTSYLYTSGSTILMGQNCTFRDVFVSGEALSASWSLCLQYLSRYQQMSSIARKSSSLLQESAKSLDIARASFQNQQQGKNTCDDQNAPVRYCDAFTSAGITLQKTFNPPNNQHVENITSNDGLALVPKVMASRDLFLRPGLEEGHFDVPTTEFWDNEVLGYPPWAFLPALSQLETFPLSLDSTDTVF